MTIRQIKEIIGELYLKDRTLVCDDYDYCLQYLKKFLDFNIYEYPSGESYWNWVIPDKYTVREAYIKDLETGRILIDVKDHPLRLASYSASFEGVLDYNELEEHLYWNENVPEGIPNYHKFQYRPWEKDWKFGVSSKQLEGFNKNGKYYVKIDTVFEKGALKVGEYFKKGKSDETILLVAHLDHPGQVNDGLIGVIVELAIMLELINKETHYSYLFLIVQEFLGSIAYLNTCKKNIKDFKMGIFAEMLSTGMNLQLQKSFLGNTYIDKVAEMVFKEQSVNFELLEYMKGVGNDEIVFESPGIEIPFVSIVRARTKGKMYDQYHTSLDNMDLLDDCQIEESLIMLRKIIDALESDMYVKRNFDGFICLSNPSVDLYFDRGVLGIDEKTKVNMHNFLFGGFRLFDGKHRISDIAMKYDVPFGLLSDFIHKMKAKGLVDLSHA